MFAVDSDRFSLILQSIQHACISKGLRVASAESCTGGLLAALLTHHSGSSAFFDAGISTYANSAKVKLLGVEENLISTFGAVSYEVAIAMAQGVRQATGTDLTISITGIAGPGGGSTEKPVGTVFCAWSSRKGSEARKFNFSGDREEVRAASCWEALSILQGLVDTF